VQIELPGNYDTALTQSFIFKQAERWFHVWFFFALGRIDGLQAQLRVFRLESAGPDNPPRNPIRTTVSLDIPADPRPNS